jgi:hypothetical protein
LLLLGIRLSKTVALMLFALLVLSSLVMVGSVFAQSYLKPSKPDFNLNIENDTAVLTIENQPFDVNNSYNYTFYYDVRILSIDGSWIGLYSAAERPIQSDSNTTVLYFPVEESALFPNVTTVAGVVIPAIGRVTFQVIALVGYLEGTGLIGEVSGWSNSQTIYLPSKASNFRYSVSSENWDTSYKLFLFSPDDQTIYDDTLLLAFLIAWTFVPLPGMEPKADYAYSIDDNSFVSIFPNETSNKPSFSYMVGISDLPEGYHHIVIGATFYQGNDMILNASSTPFIFTVRTPVPTPTPSAAPTPTLKPIPSPTTTPTIEPTSTPTDEPQQLGQEVILGVAVTVAVVCVGLGLLVYLIKRK